MPAGRVLLVVSSFLIFVLLAGVYWILWMPNTSDVPQGTVVMVPRGASFSSVVDSLRSAGAIRSTLSFKLAGRFLGSTTSIKVGKYLFKPGQSNTALLHDLVEGRSRMIMLVTIQEGLRKETVARKFSREIGIDAAKFLALCRNEEFIRRNGIEARDLEGFLFPATYHFYWQTDEAELIGRMVDGFKAAYADSLFRRQQSLGLTLNQVLTMASIVESESPIDDERAIIAGVYYNRLRKRMRLEADPTVAYALGERRRLGRNDMRTDSPYNTYTHYGLPPGPINSPGIRSIMAALYPVAHSYAYFVATGMGGHKFSVTYDEHRKAIREYRKVRRRQQAALSVK